MTLLSLFIFLLTTPLYGMEGTPPELNHPLSLPAAAPPSSDTEISPEDLLPASALSQVLETETHNEVLAHIVGFLPTFKDVSSLMSVNRRLANFLKSSPQFFPTPYTNHPYYRGRKRLRNLLLAYAPHPSQDTVLAHMAEIDKIMATLKGMPLAQTPGLVLGRTHRHALNELHIWVEAGSMYAVFKMVDLFYRLARNEREDRNYALKQDFILTALQQPFFKHIKTKEFAMSWEYLSTLFTQPGFEAYRLKWLMMLAKCQLLDAATTAIQWKQAKRLIKPRHKNPRPLPESPEVLYQKYWFHAWQGSASEADRCLQAAAAAGSLKAQTALGKAKLTGFFNLNLWTVGQLTTTATEGLELLEPAAAQGSREAAYFLYLFFIQPKYAYMRAFAGILEDSAATGETYRNQAAASGHFEAYSGKYWMEHLHLITKQEKAPRKPSKRQDPRSPRPVTQNSAPQQRATQKTAPQSRLLSQKPPRTGARSSRPPMHQWDKKGSPSA